ncbi:MAG: ArsR/SmtB family transcription factor [Pseudobdellovibrionaceae bacterium]
MSRRIKDALYDQFSRTAKALANPKRIEILDLLSQSEKTVEALADQAGLEIKNTSAQLKELKSALLVSSRREGKYVYYGIANKAVSDFLAELRTFSATQFVEIQKITRESCDDADAMTPTSRKQLLARAKKGDVILLDVRPSDEYDHAHLPYAVSIPISNLHKELKNLPKEKEIIAYCRGPYCFFANEALEILRRKGFKAIRLKDSVRDWEASGLPVVHRGA